MMDDRRDEVELRELREVPDIDEDELEEHLVRCFKRIVEGGREDSC
jgi:hypothetical protein